MNVSQQDFSSAAQQGFSSVKMRYRGEVEDRLKDLRAEVAAQPFLYLTIAFAVGFVSNTYPARMLFLIVIRMLSWLMGPVILVLGVMKLSKLVAEEGTFQGAPGHYSTQSDSGQSTDMP